MNKLLKWLKRIDDNLVHIAFSVFIFATSLLPKFPIQHVEYTYIKIRIDDILPVVLYAIFFIQFLRRKITLNTKLLIPIGLFWAAVFASFGYAYYVSHSIPADLFNIGLLHSLRRVEYMGVFFVASSLIVSEQRFFRYLKYYFITIFIVGVYGLGQKFLQFPSIQSMNPAYVDGRLLSLNPTDRINSTFGGHFDLAGYLTLSIPLIIGTYYFSKQKKYTFLYVLSLVTLLYTSARSSFVAYLASITLFLVVMKKFKYLAFALVTTAILLFVTGDMTKRILQTFQFKVVYVNTKTNAEKIDQKISVKQLPAGSYEIPLLTKLAGGSNGNNVEVDELKLTTVARENVIEQARQKGIRLTQAEIDAQAQELTKFIKPKQMFLCDISCSTRLEKEWPRAILAFRKSPLLGTGPSSLTEATDNDILRWLGELGLIGTTLFVFILVSIMQITKSLAKKANANNHRFIFYGFIFGIIALLINALYVDVFEASKVAYNFWLLAGMFVGLQSVYGKVTNTKSTKKR